MTQIPSAVTRMVDADTPHWTRIWNYLLDGLDYYEADRQAAVAVQTAIPDIRWMAVQARQFHNRVVRHLVDAGIRQILDIGSGYPVGGRTIRNPRGSGYVVLQDTHQIAQPLATNVRVAYVDNDPVVVSHARALLSSDTADGVSSVIDADLHTPDRLLESARDVLDFDTPVAVMLLQVLGHIATFRDVQRAVGTIMAAVPQGSYLIISDLTTPSIDAVTHALSTAHTGAAAYSARSYTHLGTLFEGLELVKPGLVPVNHWRTSVRGRKHPLPLYGAVARKPASIYNGNRATVAPS